MKATIIAVDFVKDTDGSFKALEMNTGVGFHPLSASVYTDITPITDFVANNNITEVDYIGSHGLGNLAATPISMLDLEAGEVNKHTNFGPRALGIINDHFSASADHTFTAHPTQTGATSVPYIEDSNEKLIIRNAYDSTALVDSIYATTALGLLELVRDFCTGSNEVSVPKSFVAPFGDDGTLPYSELLANDPQYDTINVNEIRDNGPGIPNYIVKLNSSTVDTDYQSYPKVYHIETSEQLNDLKKSLTASQILQEYIYNPDDLVEGKAKTYRIISAVAGPTLDSLHFFHPYFVSNHIAIPTAVDYLDDKSVQLWDRAAFVQKFGSLSDANFGQNILGEHTILGPDGEYDPDAIAEGYVIKSFNVDGLSLDEETVSIPSWTGSFVGTTPGNFDVSSVTQHDQIMTTFVSLHFELSDGSTLDVPPSSEILGVSDSEQNTKFIVAGVAEVGEKLLLVNDQDPSIPPTVVTITSIQAQVRVEQAVRIDVENVDTFAIRHGANSAFILHNGTYSGCACVYCGGYSYGTSNCISNACYTYPGCYQGSLYCTGSEWSTTYGCVQNKE